MKPLYPLTFTKADTSLPCQIVLLEESELPQILSFQEYLCSCVQDKDTFVPLSEKEWRFLLSHGFTFAVCRTVIQTGLLTCWDACILLMRKILALTLVFPKKSCLLSVIWKLPWRIRIFADTRCTAGCVSLE